jgi:hypothetical protein
VFAACGLAAFARLARLLVCLPGVGFLLFPLSLPGVHFRHANYIYEE